MITAHAYRRLFIVYQTLTLLMQFPNMKDYSEIKLIASSRSNQPCNLLVPVHVRQPLG